jgi:hypothetical protein
MRSYTYKEPLEECIFFFPKPYANIELHHCYDVDGDGLIERSTIAATCGDNTVDAMPFLTMVMGEFHANYLLIDLDEKAQEKHWPEDEQDRGCNECHRRREEGIA